MIIAWIKRVLFVVLLGMIVFLIGMFIWAAMSNQGLSDKERARIDESLELRKDMDKIHKDFEKDLDRIVHGETAQQRQERLDDERTDRIIAELKKQRETK